MEMLGKPSKGSDIIIYVITLATMETASNNHTHTEDIVIRFSMVCLIPVKCICFVYGIYVDDTLFTF